MARTTSVQSLARSIQSLHTQRQKHVDAIAAIDATFSQLGISAATAPRRGRPPGKSADASASASPKGRRKRKRYGESAEAFVLGLLKDKSLSTAQVDDAWKKAGRKGVANNSLTKLAKEKKVRRAENKDGRGSQYGAV